MARNQNSARSIKMLRFPHINRCCLSFIFYIWMYNSYYVSAHAFNLRTSRKYSKIVNARAARALESEPEGLSPGVKFVVAMFSITMIVLFLFFYRGVYRIEMERKLQILKQRYRLDEDSSSFASIGLSERSNQGPLSPSPAIPSEAPIDPPPLSAVDAVTLPRNTSKKEELVRQQSDATEVGGFEVRSLKRHELERNNREDAIEDEIVEQDDDIQMDDNDDEMDENDETNDRRTYEKFRLTRMPSL